MPRKTSYGQPALSFFFNDTATTEIYTLSLHDALPIYRRGVRLRALARIGHIYARRRQVPPTGSAADPSHPNRPPPASRPFRPSRIARSIWACRRRPAFRAGPAERRAEAPAQSRRRELRTPEGIGRAWRRSAWWCSLSREVASSVGATRFAVNPDVH